MAAKYVNCPSCNYVRCRNPKGCGSCPLWQNAILETVNGGVK